MGTDIIADSQTERTINLLMRGEADGKAQQTTLASILISMTKLVDEIADIKQSLWKPADLQRIVDERHKALCSDCPAKKQAEAPSEDKKQTVLSQILSPTVMIFVMAVLSLLTAMYVAIGRQGFQDVTEVVTPIIHQN